MEDLLDDIARSETPASPTKKYLSGWTDAFIVAILTLGPAYIYLFSKTPKDGLPWLHWFVIGGFILYRFISVFFFGTTLGMRMMGVKLLNRYEEKLSTKERLLASFFILAKGVEYYKIK